MNFKTDNKFIQNYFFESLMNAADEYRAVGWSEISQKKRFNKVLDIGELQGKSILDVGCGLGALYGFLKEKGIVCNYTGFDIVPEMIKTAQKRYTEAENNFVVFDILHEDLKRDFDYVVAIGPLNVKLYSGNNAEMTIELMKRMLSLSKIGIAFSMTSSFTEKPNRDSCYYDPIVILTEVSRISKNVKFDHTYLPHDFMLFCYKKSLYDF